MAKISLIEIKKQLKTYKTEELVSIIIDCYKSSADVKKYIHMMLDPESAENQLYDEAKKKILHQFYPDLVNRSLNWQKPKKLLLNLPSLAIIK